jgi:phosphoribosylformylglycinamidine synthase I
MKAGVLLFPGSNCAADAHYVWGNIIGLEVDYVWHKDAEAKGYDLLIVPGGFSYGDYLRAGAMASVSPAIKALKQHAEKGGLVLGICNGFQILTESGLLPGALLRNNSLRFISRPQTLRVETTDTPFTSGYNKNAVVTFPIAHNEGNFRISDDGLKMLQDDDRIAFRYSLPDGTVNADSNANGSKDNIAGIVNKERNVLGMMPHPERAAEDLLGSNDGRVLFQSIVKHLVGV